MEMKLAFYSMDTNNEQVYHPQTSKKVCNKTL